MIHSPRGVNYAYPLDGRQKEGYASGSYLNPHNVDETAPKCSETREGIIAVDSPDHFRKIEPAGNYGDASSAVKADCVSDVRESRPRGIPSEKTDVNMSSEKFVMRINKHSNLHMAKKVNEFPMTFVEQRRKWTAKIGASIINTDEEGELYYNPDPYRPVPPAKGSPNVITRMHYAALRVDSRKYRAQKSVAKATSHMESASCNKCNMRFFLPLNHFRSRIAYSVSLDQHSLPTTFFRCPICQTESEVLM